MDTNLKFELQHQIAKCGSNTDLLPFYSASPIATQFQVVRCNGITNFSYLYCKECKKLFKYNRNSTTNLKRHVNICKRHQTNPEQKLEIDFTQSNSSNTNRV